MELRRYGRSGMDVSAIGFGAMRFENIADQDACAAMVKRAYDLGINYFDTAPGYFGGQSEERLGLAFRAMKRTRSERPFYVSTKSNRGRPDEIRRDLEQSLTRMGLDSVDVFHMWWIVRPETYRERKALGALEAFTRIREEGLAKHIALSSHMSGPEIAEVLADYDFDGVLLGYSAMNCTFRDAALTAAAASGRGVAVMNPLGGGVIPRHAERFDFLRTRPDETVIQGALRFLLDDPRISVVLVGFGNEQHVEEAVAAAAPHEPLRTERREAIRARVASTFDRMCTGCGYCAPCPQGLDLPRLMQGYNQALFGNEPQVLSSLKYGYGADGEAVEACTRCGLCETRCTQKLPIPDRLEHIAGLKRKSTGC